MLTSEVYHGWPRFEPGDAPALLTFYRHGVLENLNLLENYAKVDGMFSLHLRQFGPVFERLTGSQVPAAGTLDFLAVTHVGVRGPEGVAWTRRATALPWVTAGQRALFLGETAARERFLSDDYDPRREVILVDGDALGLPGSETDGATVTRVKWGSDRVEFVVETDQLTMAAVSQVYSPHWRARVDGVSVRLHRANVAFQAVSIPPGRHEVRLEYVDPWFRGGLAISLISVAILTAIVVRGVRVRRVRCRERQSPRAAG
jgi:hypothetical protein